MTTPAWASFRCIACPPHPLQRIARRCNESEKCAQLLVDMQHMCCNHAHTFRATNSRRPHKPGGNILRHSATFLAE